MIPWDDQIPQEVPPESSDLLDLLPPFVKSLSEGQLERLMEMLMQEGFVHLLAVFMHALVVQFTRRSYSGCGRIPMETSFVSLLNKSSTVPSVPLFCYSLLLTPPRSNVLLFAGQSEEPGGKGGSKSLNPCIFSFANPCHLFNSMKLSACTCFIDSFNVLIEERAHNSAILLKYYVLYTSIQSKFREQLNDCPVSCWEQLGMSLLFLFEAAYTVYSVQ